MGSTAFIAHGYPAIILCWKKLEIRCNWMKLWITSSSSILSFWLCSVNLNKNPGFFGFKTRHTEESQILLNFKWTMSPQFINAFSIEKSFTLTGHLMLDPFQQFIAERCTLLCDRDCIHFVLITFISLR